MKVMDIYNKADDSTKSRLYDKYSVRMYFPYTRDEIYSDSEELLEKFLDPINKDEWIELGEDGSSAVVFIWNTDADEEDMKEEDCHGQEG